MASGGNDKAPLIENTDDKDETLASHYSKEASLALPGERSRGVASVNDTETAGLRLRAQDNIVAIFVVAFDTHRGKLKEIRLCEFVIYFPCFIDTD